MLFEISEDHRKLQTEAQELTARWGDRAQELRRWPFENRTLHPGMWRDFCDAGFPGLIVPRVARGALTFAVAVTEADAGQNFRAMETVIEKRIDRVRIDGEKAFTLGVEVAARLLIYRAADLYDAGVPHEAFWPEVFRAKVLCADLADMAADQAIRTFGDAGLNEDEGLVQLDLDARAFRVIRISQEVARKYLSEHVLKLPRSA